MVERHRGTLPEIADLRTTGQVCKMFNVTAVTVSNWRKKYGMPCIIIGDDDDETRNVVLFHVPSLEVWAHANEFNLKTLEFWKQLSIKRDPKRWSSDTAAVK